VAGPAVTAVAALVIALLSYTDQHSTDKAQARAQAAASEAVQMQDADEVSWYDDENSSGNSDTIVIVNTSAYVIDQIWFLVYPFTPGPESARDSVFFTEDDVLTACSQMTIHLSWPIPKAGPNFKPLPRYTIADFADLEFQNHDGFWSISQVGWLSQQYQSGIPQVPLENTYEIPSSIITVSRAPTCSPT
jgi:hypothetical protein